MRLVLDCNIWVSAGWKNGVSRQALFEAIKNHKIFVSVEIVREYKKVITYSKLKNISELLEGWLNDFLPAAYCVNSTLCPIKLLDPKDEIYLACAITANADIIITGNTRHFPFREYQGIRIMTPREFIDMFLLSH